MGMKLLKTIISICSMTMIADVLGATTTTGRNSILLAENEEGKHHIRGLADTTNNNRVLKPKMMKMPSNAKETKPPSMSKPPSYSKSPSVSKPPSSKPMMGMMGMMGMMEMMGMMGKPMMGKPMREKPNMIGKPK